MYRSPPRTSIFSMPAPQHSASTPSPGSLREALAPPSPPTCAGPSFAHAVESLSTALSLATERHYNIAVRSFLVYLGAEYPKVTALEQLRRDPHILGWMARLRAQTPSLATATCIARFIALRAIRNELAWTHQLAELAHLIRREDIPRTPQSLP